MPVTLQPTTLKYKNSNGVFQSADCIKGDKGDQGDDYVLTTTDKQDIASLIDDSCFVQTVSGTTPSIAAEPNIRYICGEVSTIDITAPATGTIDIIFTSGTTAAVLTVTSTVKWPAWFDATALEPNTIYELLITDATYGSVMTWVA